MNKDSSGLVPKNIRQNTKGGSRWVEKVEWGDMICEKLAVKASMKFHKPEFRYLLGL